VIMPVADDDYRKKLAERQRKMNATKRDADKNNTRDEEVFNPYAAGFSYVGDFIKENMSPLMGAVDQASTDPSQALVTTMLSTAGAGGKGKSVRLIDKLSTPILQRAVQTAQAEGRQLGGQWLEDAAIQGVKFGQSSVTRTGRGAEDELFNFINELERLGVKPQTANRFLKGFAEYVDDPFQGMSTMGENMSRTTPGFKEALVERLFGRLSKAAEDSFLG